MDLPLFTEVLLQSVATSNQLVEHPKFRTNGSISYDVVQEYSLNNDGQISASPGWAMAVVRLSKPLTYSRKERGSIGDIVSGALQRREQPLIIFDDCVQLSISRNKDSHTKNLSAFLKSANTNYLSANVILPGDWILAWMNNDEGKTKDVIKRVLKGEAVNKFDDGFKFVGRVHSVRKKIKVSGELKIVNYSIQAVMFKELDSSFYYDVHLATSAANGGTRSIALFMKQLGLDWTMFAEAGLKVAGRNKDNMAELIPTLIDVVVGKGVAHNVNQPTDRAYAGVGDQGVSKNRLQEGAPQASIGVKGLEESPYAYLIPVSVAQYLGKNVADKSRQSVFAYSDILHLLIGVQQYDANTKDSPSKGFWPRLDFGNSSSKSNDSRSFCEEHLKGSYLPQEGNFINIPLWQMLQQFLNPALNEMYTALKLGRDGTVKPTLVVRQIPFSTSAIKEDEDLMLTRFLDLPRWKIDPIMVTDLDVGRSEATHFNMVKVTGDAPLFSGGQIVSPTRQLVLNPPIFDVVDIARSGVHPFMQVVNCSSLPQLKKDGRLWTEAIADWTIGSQFTLNGTMECVGIQSPIAEGDNLEFDGIVYHIESITDTCVIQVDGKKRFSTILYLTNGMPAKQSESEEFPVYPGFSVLKDQGQSVVDGNDAKLTTYDPGMSGG